MNHGQRRIWMAPLGLALALALALGGTPVRAADNECLIGFGDVLDGATLQCTDGCPTCDADGTAGQCTFKLKVSLNQAAGACTATALKKPVVRGRCRIAASGLAATSGPAFGDASIVVKLTKKNRRAGKCKITAKAVSPRKPRRTDKDVVTLICNPPGSSCPTTTTLISTTTTTTLPCPGPTSGVVCEPIVVGQPIPNTYKLQGTTGEKRCTTNSAANRFGPCTADADCGNTAGACMNLPWVTADGQVMPFSTGTETTFTVAAADSAPTCEHSVCIPCGNAHAACPGIPGCEVSGNPNGCVPRGTQGCCDQPGFIVPTFFVNILGGLCSRVDQIACGGGVVNTSHPQTGHNQVMKVADTSDPGADCCYNSQPASECIGGTNLNDDPTLAAQNGCTPGGAGFDYKGKIVRTVGGCPVDADGIHFRLVTPELSTTWTDGQSPPGTCANGSTYDDGELLVSQLILKAEPTTAGATGSFGDLNGDGCKRAGAGFISATNSQTDGPIFVPGAPTGPARPQSYDGTQGSVSAAVSEVFSGSNSPIRDIGFVAVTPQMPVVVVSPVSCSCTVQPDCPE